MGNVLCARSQPIPASKDKHSSGFSHHRLVLFILDFHVIGIQYVLLRVWILPLNIMFLKLVHAVVCTHSSSLCSLIFLSATDGHVSCGRFSAILIKATVRFLARVSWWTWTSISLEDIPSSEISRLRDKNV